MAPLSAKDVCNYCMKECGRKNLRSCSVCRLVQYCSRDCQKAGWKTHKKSCRVAVRRETMTPDLEEHWQTVSRWLNAWKMSFTTWSIWALNMPRHDRDCLSKYCFYLDIKRRPEIHKEAAQLFRLETGAIVPREEITRIMIEDDDEESVIEDWETDLRGDDTVQIVVRAERSMRFIWFSIRDAEERSKKEPDLFSDAMAMWWPEYLKEAIEQGDTMAHEGFVKKVAERLAKTVGLPESVKNRKAIE